MTSDPKDARFVRLTRTDFLRGAAALPLLSTLTPRSTAQNVAVPQSQTPRPNIVWIIAEDLSPDIGCYGSTYARTPTLDALAAEGIRFTNAIAPAPICSASRSGIFTGRWPIALGTGNHRSRAVPAERKEAGKDAVSRIFSEYLRAAGYYCTNNAKTDYNFPAPLTAWDANSNGAHWRNRPDPKQPFFAVFHLGTTHESQLRLSDDDFAEAVKTLPPERRHDPLKMEPQRDGLPPYYPYTPLVRRDWARYHDLIARMDQQVGQILADLTADGLANNTLIVFFADHGRSLPRGKRLCYDAGLRVPLLVRWPGTLTANIVRDDVISLIDLAPTMLSAAGVRVPNGLDGQILFGTGQSKRAREIAFAARDRIDEVTDTIRAARDRRFLYIRNDRPEVPYFPYCDYAEATPTLRELRRLVAEEYGQRGTGTPPDRLTPVQRQIMAAQKPEEELYDTQADPHCLKNLANDAKFRRDRDRLRSAVEKWRKDTNDLHRLPEAQLEARWKPNGEYPQCAPAKIDVDQAGMSLVITLSCPTPGASIAYTTDPANSPETTWGLYIAPLSVSREELTAAVKERGGITLRVRACRAGWADSDELSVRIDGKSGTASA